MRNRFCTSLLGLGLLAACGDKHANEPVELDWNIGDTWHLAATYRLADAHTEKGAVGLDGGEVALGELWSDEVVWTYQVVEDDLTPAKSDVLYDFARTRRGKVRQLDVVRAWIDPGLNDVDGALVEADPVVYLVFTSKRQRLAGMVAYTWENGERVERAWRTRDVGRSWSPLSQSMLTAAPTYLAPYGVRLADGQRKLENGHWLHTTRVDDATVDAVYDDEIGGGIVASRYELGKPWPTWTVADNVEVRLLSAREVNGLRRRAAGPPPADYDFRAGLQASLDIDAALELDEAAMAGEPDDFGAPDGYQPWNGSWWPQSQGELVFGYNSGRPTLSDRLKDDIDPLKRDLDGLSDRLRELDQGSAEYDEVLAEYKAKQDELIDKLVAFYDGVLTDLDGGALRVEGGQLVHDDGWSYDIDRLSPMDKVALAMYLGGQTYPNPFYVPAWELLNHYNPAGGSWWGHCNGWSGAAILNFEPTTDAVNTIDGVEFRFTPADQKGLLTETHYSTYSHFFGSRYYKEGDDIADLSPAAFHKIISFYLRDQQVPLVFDTDAGEQVWNFPAYNARVEITETDRGNAGLLNVNTATYDDLLDLEGIGPVLADRIIEYRELNGPFQSVEELREIRGIGARTMEKLDGAVTVDPVRRTFHVTAWVDFATDGVDEAHVDDGPPGPWGFTETYSYELVTDANGLVLEGTWDDVEDHPDFAWVPYANPSEASGSENYYLPHSALVEALGTDLSRL